MPHVYLKVSSRFPQGSNAWSKQGAEHVFAGRKTRVCRERNGILPDSGARPYTLGRPPVYLRPPALICWSGRPKPIFILSLGVLLGEVEPAAALADFSQTWMDTFTKAVEKVGVKVTSANDLVSHIIEITRE